MREQCLWGSLPAPAPDVLTGPAAGTLSRGRLLALGSLQTRAPRQTALQVQLLRSFPFLTLGQAAFPFQGDPKGSPLLPRLQRRGDGLAHSKRPRPSTPRYSIMVPVTSNYIQHPPTHYVMTMSHPLHTLSLFLTVCKIGMNNLTLQDNGNLNPLYRAWDIVGAQHTHDLSSSFFPSPCGCSLRPVIQVQ